MMRQVQFTNLFPDPTFSGTVSPTTYQGWRLEQASLISNSGGEIVIEQSESNKEICSLHCYPDSNNVINLIADHVYMITWEEKVELPYGDTWINTYNRFANGYFLIARADGPNGPNPPQGTNNDLGRLLSLFRPEDDWVRHRGMWIQDKNTTTSPLRLKLAGWKNEIEYQIFNPGEIIRHIRRPILMDVTSIMPTSVNWFANNMPFFSGSQNIAIEEF